MAFTRARSREKIMPIADLGSTLPNPDTANAQLPKSWYAIVSGPFKEARFGIYDIEICREAKGQSNSQ
eukprot:5698883-Pleurochrysis_carterae.AAC.3